MRFDIPINFSVEAKTEGDAERLLYKELTRMIAKHGYGELIEFQNFEFIAEESCCGGCGDNHDCQGKPIQLPK